MIIFFIAYLTLISYTGPSPPLKKHKAGLASVFAKLSGGFRDQGTVDTPDQKFKKELDRYEVLPHVSIDDDVLVWWNDHESSFPLLRKFARKYLAVLATSTPSERVFSTGGRVISDHRICLTGEHADQLIFLAMNKQIVPKPKWRIIIKRNIIKYIVLKFRNWLAFLLFVAFRQLTNSNDPPCTSFPKFTSGKLPNSLRYNAIFSVFSSLFHRLNCYNQRTVYFDYSKTEKTVPYSIKK